MKDTKGTGIQEKELAKSSGAKTMFLQKQGLGSLCSPTHRGSAVQWGKQGV